MLIFYILEIQKNIEKKRQIYGKKLAIFLLSIFNNFLKKSDELIANKIFCFWLIFLFFSLSIFLRSNLDIGYLSAYELSNKNDLSLIHLINLISLKIAKISGFNKILVADYFINFLAIISLIFSAKILTKSNLVTTHQNLIIIAFALGFFLQISAIEYGEFIVENSLFLIVIFPYISFLLKRKNCNFISQIFAILVCASIIFAIFTPYIVKEKFLIANFTDFFISQLFSKIILLTIFLIFLYKKISCEDRILLISSFFGLLILCLEFFTNRNYESCFFALITPAIIKIFYDLIKNNKIDFTNKLLFALLPFLAFLDEGLNFVRSLMLFWMIIIPVSAFLLHKELEKNFANYPSKTYKLTLLISLPPFILFAFAALFLSFTNNNSFLVLSILTFFFFLFYYEKTYQKFYHAFSSLFTFVQFCVFFSLISFYIFTIFKSFQGNNIYKSPNYLSDNIIKYSNSYLKDKNDKVLIISDLLSEKFPTLSFLHQEENYLPDYKNLFFDKKTKIIFIKNNLDSKNKDRCLTGFLENNFSDQKFRENFAKNYQYLGKIFLSKDLEKKPQLEFFARKKDEFDNIDLSRQKVIYNFEIYVRKND